MNYETAYKRLRALDALGSRMGLETMRELMGRLGDPQDKIRTVHVAGTNGKGSVIAILSDSLERTGGFDRIGTYTSPALECWRENIRIDGEWIPEVAAAGLLARIFEICGQMVSDGFAHPTRFEVETAVAFLYFYESACGTAFIETGLGGETDATNVIKKPDFAVLTPIGLDHTGILGGTLAEIAEAKCGIIKEDVRVVTFRQSPEVMAVIERVCKEKNTSCVFFDRYFDFDRIIQKVEWFGRVSTLCRKPLFIVDGAHNPMGAEYLLKRLKLRKKAIFIMGIFKDKDYEKMLEILAPHARKIITVDMPENQRLLRADALKAAADKYHTDVTASVSPADAVRQAFAAADKQDVIVSCGSLSTIAAVAAAVKERGA